MEDLVLVSGVTLFGAPFVAVAIGFQQNLLHKKDRNLTLPYWPKTYFGVLLLKPNSIDYKINSAIMIDS
jgi:hypothetical protein